MLLALRSLWEEQPTPPIPIPLPIPVGGGGAVGGWGPYRVAYERRMRIIQEENDDNLDVVRVLTEWLSRL